MKKTKKAKAVKKLKIAKSAVSEREQVRYIENTDKSIQCIAHVKNSETKQMSEHKRLIDVLQVKELRKRVENKEEFFAYINKTLHLLKHLQCDAQAKKLHICTNTQYDSRHKLRAMLMQVSLSNAKQKAKVKKTAKRKKAVKA